jgi:hypothetical protein
MKMAFYRKAASPLNRWSEGRSEEVFFIRRQMLLGLFTVS